MRGNGPGERPPRGGGGRALRRALAALAAVPLAAGCGAGAAEEPSGAQAPELPETTAYRVAEGEPAAQAKRAAVGFLEAVLNYERGGGDPESARERLRAAGRDGTAVPDGFDLLAEDAAGSAQVVYPSLGGLTGDRASVMTVVETSLLRGEELTSAVRTVDVRLSRSGDGAWDVTEIASTGGAPPGEGADGSPPPAASPGGAAGEVLASDRITLPDSSRWDVMAGRTDERLLRMMLDLSAEHPVSVAVLTSGHPVNVFGSDSVSNHTRGRAVDIWAVGGTSVSDLRLREKEGPGGPVRALMELALENGATEVGGPWALNTPAGASFTDTVHQDHLHIAFKR
ncbi:hypothetical protein J0910_01230 [Nocardiopsis sp. CNT-189]|uniref:hypothetical protein n=1 Tax=Nocardiopsis oceanisediminis TaxID=2816862 RepID=UPI003B29DCDF